MYAEPLKRPYVWYISNSPTTFLDHMAYPSTTQFDFIYMGTCFGTNVNLCIHVK